MRKLLSTLQKYDPCSVMPKWLQSYRNGRRMPDGKAIIATVNGSSLDTLAKADVKNGSFEFTGNVVNLPVLISRLSVKEELFIHVRKCKILQSMLDRQD